MSDTTLPAGRDLDERRRMFQVRLPVALVNDMAHLAIDLGLSRQLLAERLLREGLRAIALERQAQEGQE